MFVMSDKDGLGPAGADRLSRTQWLLVVLIGIVVWLAGFVLEIPLLGILGAAATLIGVVAAISTRSRG